MGKVYNCIILVIEKLQKEIYYIIDTILDNISCGYMDFCVYLGIHVYYNLPFSVCLQYFIVKYYRRNLGENYNIKVELYGICCLQLFLPQENSNFLWFKIIVYSLEIASS